MSGDALAEGSSGMNSQVAGEDELAVEGEGTQTTSTSDFISENGQPVGLDVAIVRCIERYGNLGGGITSMFLLSR